MLGIYLHYLFLCLWDMKTNHKILVLDTNLDRGHGQVSGCYERYKIMALEYVFIFYLAGIKE